MSVFLFLFFFCSNQRKKPSQNIQHECPNCVTNLTDCLRIRIRNSVKLSRKNKETCLHVEKEEEEKKRHCERKRWVTGSMESGNDAGLLAIMSIFSMPSLMSSDRTNCSSCKKWPCVMIAPIPQCRWRRKCRITHIHTNDHRWNHTIKTCYKVSKL